MAGNGSVAGGGELPGNSTSLTKFGRAVASTASTLMQSQYGDLSGTAYQQTMTDLARRPQFQKRMFSFASRRTPVAVVKERSKTAIEYHALTAIPEELLRDVPAADNNFSLYQGFEALRATDDDAPPESDMLLLADSESGSATGGGRSGAGAASFGPLPETPKELRTEQERISRKLDLLEIRKDLASNEIREIDARIERLQKQRLIVFDRVADLEYEELQLEQRAQQVVNALADVDEAEQEEDGSTTQIEADKTPEPGVHDVTPPLRESPVDGSATGGGGLLSESIYGKLQQAESANAAGTPTKNKKGTSRLRRRSISRRKTMPTLQQFYVPGKEIRTIDAHADSVTCLDFDIPFGTAVSASLDDTVTVWDLSRGASIGSLAGHNASVQCIQMDNNIVATGSADATVKLWDIANSSEPLLETFAAHLGEVTALNFHGTTLVSGSSDKTIRQWDMATGRCVQTLDVLWAAAQSSIGGDADDSRWRRQSALVGADRPADFVGALQVFDAALATGTADGVVRLWDLRTGQVHRTLVGHTGAVTCLQFDDAHLVTGSLDRSIRVWDLRTGTISDAYAYDSGITSLHFDARRIVCSNGDNTAKIYDRALEKHSTVGAGENDPSAAVINYVRAREGYLVEGRQDGKIGVWAC